jgi:hypothetical protein
MRPAEGIPTMVDLVHILPSVLPDAVAWAGAQAAQGLRTARR